MCASLDLKPSSQRHRAHGVFLAAGFAALFAQIALAADPAQDLVRAMHDATRHLNYVGVFVYQRGVQIDSMRLVHEFAGSNEKERLISLSGPAREVIRDGTLVTCLFADDQAAVLEKNSPRDLISIGWSVPVEILLESYSFSLGDGDRVAGRDTVSVTVTPPSEDRYAYRLWVDKQSKLLLKSVILGRGGRILEQVQFTQIEILDEIPPAMLQPEITSVGFTWRTDEGDANPSAQAPETAWRVHWVPHGFQMKDNNVQHMATSRMPVEHLVYSDGLAMVSVFVEKLMPDEAPLQGYSARGAVNAFSRVADNHQITVIGELPLPTVRQIASSVARTGN